MLSDFEVMQRLPGLMCPAIHLVRMSDPRVLHKGNDPLAEERHLPLGDQSRGAKASKQREKSKYEKYQA